MESNEQPATSEGEITNLYALYETDPELEKKGLGLRFGKAVFYCRRAGGANTAYDTAMEAKTRNMTSRLQLAAISNEQSNAMMIEVYAETVCIGWEGVRDRAGNLLDFNQKNFIKLMTELPTLWRAIRQAAADHENFLKDQAKQEGEAVGNS